MMLFVFKYKKDGNSEKEIPAVYFTNDFITKSQLEERTPGLEYLTNQNVEIPDAPMNVLLYDNEQELGLLESNAELMEENSRLKDQLAELNKGSHGGVLVNKTPEEISKELGNNDDDDDGNFVNTINS